MDGNRRWAKQQGVSLKDGVFQGLARANVAVDFCLKHDIKYLSLFAFSIENLQRSPIERACVFDALVEKGREYAQDMAKKGVRARIVGDRSLFPDDVQDVCDAIETMTADKKDVFVQFLFCYGGRQEIVAAAKNIAQQVSAGQLSLDSLTPETFKKFTWMGDIPDPELLIRTGFANRLSNFLLYQAAYSELYFPQCLWPDMDDEQFEKAFAYYMSCKRNFGR
jgi:undecaprenyl diphosphate synthase